MKLLPAIRNALLLFLTGLCFIVSACKDGKSPTGTQIETGIPDELKNAILVFQTDQGIYLQFSGKEAELLVADGNWPRISPDGTLVAFLKGKEVGIISLETREVQILTQTSIPKTLTFSGDGQEVWYSEGKTVSAVNLNTLTQRNLAEDGEFLEIDSGPAGKKLIATVKSFGYKVKIFDLESGEAWSLGKGCSASLSPNGKFATNNLDGHRELALINIAEEKREKVLPAPEGHITDNQFWSNHPDWIISISETDHQLLGHRVKDGKVWSLGQLPGADRPDLWVPPGL